MPRRVRKKDPPIHDEYGILIDFTPKYNLPVYFIQTGWQDTGSSELDTDGDIMLIIKGNAVRLA